MAWDSGVNAPSAPSYNSPLIDFSTLGNLAQDYAQGQQNQFAQGQRQRELMLQQPIDAKDPQAVAAELMRRGGAPYAAGLMPFLQSQQPGQVSPLLGGPGGGQGAPAGGGQQQPASLPAPPQASGMASQPAPMAVPPAQQGPGGGYGGGDNGVNTVAAVVGTKLPSDSPKTGVIIGNVAKILGVDPNAPMSPEQQQRATRLVDAYAARTASGGEATPVPMDGVKVPPSAGGGNARVADAFAGLGPQGGQQPAQAAPPVQGQPPPVQGQPQPMQGRPQPVQGQPQQAQPAPQPQQPAPEPAPTGVVLPEGYTDPRKAVIALRREAARVAASPNPRTAAQAGELNAWAKEIQDSTKPHNVGGALVDSQGHVIYEGAGGMAPAAVDAAAERYFETGTLPAGMARTPQGRRDAAMIQNRNAEMLAEKGISSAEQTKAWQEYRARGIGLNAGARTAATREENLNLILKAADAAIPAALEASRNVERIGGRWVPINQIVQKGEVMASNPELIEFGMANLQLAEHWARAMNPTGVMRESDRDKALSFLSTATSAPTYERAVRQLQKQITRERDAIRSQRAGETPKPGAEAAPPAAAGTPPPGQGTATPDKDGWVTLPSGVRIREKQ